MAETAEHSLSSTDAPQHWCFQCYKRVSIERKANVTDMTCLECKNGFVESIASTSPQPSVSSSGSSDQVDDPYFGSQFLQVLGFLAQSTRDDDASPPPPPNRVSGGDYLRIELDRWDHDEEDGDDDEEDGFELHDEGEEHEEDEEQDRPVNDNQHEDDEDLRRRRRDGLRLRIRDLATRTRGTRNRILDWAEIFRLQVPESDRYVGNPEDYVNATEYEALLQWLAESEGGRRRGAPPAAKSAVEALPIVKIESKDDALVCAICKDLLDVGDMAKKLPCGHKYHGDCIVPWLGCRNSCPVCRFELPTDDKEYEDGRIKRATATAGGASGSGVDTGSG